MPMIEWTPELSVGIKRFDNEHKLIVEMINKLFDAFQNGRGQEAVHDILDQLVDYMRNHTSGEEFLLERHQYPNLLAHRTEHGQMSDQIRAFQQRFENGGDATTCIDLLKFLKTWLTNHIQGCDKQYSNFLHERGVR
ncbi:Bacteriohemerythrin [Azospirillaceae bacterium]